MKSFARKRLRNWIRSATRWSTPIIAEELEKYHLNQLRERLGVNNKEFFAQLPITVTGDVRVGERVSIAAYVHIWGEGGVWIGNRVMIGPNTSIVSITHKTTEKIMKGTKFEAPVVIEDDVWIGAHAVVLPGVTIGEGSVIGAGAVVAKNIPSQTIAKGIPATDIKKRETRN